MYTVFYQSIAIMDSVWYINLTWTVQTQYSLISYENKGKEKHKTLILFN